MRVKVWKFSVQRQVPEAVRWLPGGHTQRLRAESNTSVVAQRRTDTGTTAVTDSPGCTVGSFAEKATWNVEFVCPRSVRLENPCPEPRYAVLVSPSREARAVDTSIVTISGQPETTWP